jgi:hypothetical protein
VRHQILDETDIDALAEGWRPSGAGQSQSGSPLIAQELILPKIQVGNRQLREVSTDALASLRRNNNPPKFFTRGGSMVSLLTIDPGRTVIAQMTEARLRGHLARCANYYRLTKQGDRV